MGLKEKLASKANALKERVGGQEREREDEDRLKQSAQATAVAAKKLAQEVERRAPEADFEDAPTDDRDVADRAKRAGEARAPINAGLHLSKNPREIESFARSSMSVDAGGVGSLGQPHHTERREEPAGFGLDFPDDPDQEREDEMLLGMGLKFAEPSEEAENMDDMGELDFEDPFGVGGGR